MALALESSPTPLQCDDEATLTMLVNGDADGDFAGRLDDFQKRLDEDFAVQEGNQYWNGLVNGLNRNFKYASAPIPEAAAAAVSTTSDDRFDTDTGKKHIAATCALLKISKDRAIQVTRGVAQNLYRSEITLPALLGTKDFLMKTMLYHFQQRLARLQLLTECLRVEQDDGNGAPEAVTQILDKMDATFLDGPRQRGLFRKLLTIAGMPLIMPDRDQLAPAQNLSFKDSSQDGLNSFNSLAASVLEETRLRTIRERVQAMEALLALLYRRINSGVQRSDLCLLVHTFQSSGIFKSKEEGLCELAGLICAESMQLWRAFQPDNDPRVGWAAQHPLLRGVTPAANTGFQMEMEALKTILLDSSSLTETFNLKGPQSLALLSFGLLLRLAHDSLENSTNAATDSEAYWRTFKASGTEISTIANEWGFEYLKIAIAKLVESDASTPGSGTSRTSKYVFKFYDWQYSNSESSPLLIQADTKVETTADIILYTSIAREVLVSAISAFPAILLTQAVESTSNIGLLCSLASSLYRSNQILSEEFWTWWQQFVSPNPPPMPLPMCDLFFAAHELSKAALAAYQQNGSSNKVLLPAVAPFFQLLASLCHSPDIVEASLDSLPAGFIRATLLACYLPEAVTGSDEFQNSCAAVLNALAYLAKIGQSQEALEKLRLSLEDPTQENQVMMDGPRVLTRIAISTNNPDIIEPALHLMALLLDGASQQWAMESARQCMPSHIGKSFLVTFLEPSTGTTNAAAMVLLELIEHTTALLFCDSFKDNDATAFLKVVAEGIISSSANLIPYMGTSASSAEIVLRAFARFLSLIRAVMELHQSPTVRTVACDVRDSLINVLATSTGLGEAIAYFSVAPVSLSIASSLWDALESGSLVTKVCESKPEGEKSFGEWQFVASKSEGQHTDVMLGRKHLLDTISEFGCKDFDFEDLKQRNWTGASDKLAPLRVAKSAMQLFSMWAFHVDDIVSSCTEGDDPIWGQTGSELITKLSPISILTSRSTCPFSCQENSTFASAWESAGIPNFDLILPYLTSTSTDVMTFETIPTTASLDVLHACILHATRSNSIDTGRASMVFRAVYNSTRLPKLLAESIDGANHRTNQLSNAYSPTGTDKAAIINGLLSLRLLWACIEASPAIAEKMLHQEGKLLMPMLVDISSKASELLGLNRKGSPEIFNSSSSITQMRLAAGAIAALSAFFTSARSMAPGQSGARLAKLADNEAGFVSNLLTMVMGYSNESDIESKITPSRESEYVRCTVATFMSRSLDILTTEVTHYQRNVEKRNVSLEQALMKSFLQPQRFTSFNGYKYAATSTAQFASMGLDRLQALRRPVALLHCFPRTSSLQSSQDAYALENSFDVEAASQWLALTSRREDHEVQHILTRLSIAHQLAQCDLRLIASWKEFAEVLVHFQVNRKEQDGTACRSADILQNLAQDTLGALHLNIEAINDTQAEIAEDFMESNRSQMAKLLSELFLFFLEMASQDVMASKVLDSDELLDLLQLLTKTSEMIHAMVTSQHAGVSAMGNLEMCCMLERPLLASAILLDSLISAGGPLSQQQRRRELDAYTSLCRAACKVLKILGELLKHAERDSIISEKREQDNQDTLRCCISLFTILVAKGHGSQMKDASYFKLVSEILIEYNVLSQIIAHGMSASKEASLTILASGGIAVDYGMRGPSAAEMKNLDVVQSVLNLLYSVAEANNSDMLSTFVGTHLSQFVTRNPLFHHAGQVWAQNGRNMPPRGYVVSNGGANASRRSMLSGSLQQCSNDPLHSIWLTSMKVMQASLRSSTQCLNLQGTESIGKHFFDASVEFLEIHRVTILSCLKSCSSKVTGNMLLEATQIFTLASELFKRDHRDAFLHSNVSLCAELVDWAKAVVVNISKFLGASGTARELFRGLETYESLDPGLVDQGPGVDDAKARHPLLSGGRLQDAKHEAYKFSHFAARCCERITKIDIETGLTVPAHLRHLSLERRNDEPLEEACRLSVTSDYALRMERIASQCLSQAISTIWKTHPVSHSFKVFSEREAMQLDVMNLVQIGVVISYRAACGESLLVEQTSENFDDLRFGRVCSSDTVNRTWAVKAIRGNEDVGVGEVEVVRARQLAGIEDISMRKVVTAYLPAPDTMDALEKGPPSLSVGHLILVLRWCHQKYLSLRESKWSDGPEQMMKTVQIAEQTVALLVTELSIHSEISSDLNMPKSERSQLDFQIYEMFADPEVLTVLDTNAPTSSVHMQEGRLKCLIQGMAWDAIRPQVERELERTWRTMKDQEQKRQKRVFGETNWYSGNLGRSRGYKSAFRG